jgi:hypothetical protein
VVVRQIIALVAAVSLRDAVTDQSNYLSFSFEIATDSSPI